MNESSSLAEVLRKQGKAVSGDAVKYLKNTLDSLGISYVHLNYNTHRVTNKPMELEEILQENVNYQASKLKIKLIKAGLKTDCCEICGCSNIWNDKPLTLQLHHVNGNHSDNRLENLQIVCPNCHTQLSSEQEESTRKVKYCPDCGRKIQKTSTYCYSCYVKHRIRKGRESWPSKEELLELIQKYSFVDIGKMYGTSDRTIYKRCKAYGIPATKKELREYLQQSM